MHGSLGHSVPLPSHHVYVNRKRQTTIKLGEFALQERSFRLFCKLNIYRKIPKRSPGAYSFQRPFLRGLYSEGLLYGGKFAFQNRLASLIVGRKLTVFALFYFVFVGNFQVQSPGGGAYIWRGDLTEGLFCVTSLGDLYLEGRIHGGAYFRNFTVNCRLPFDFAYAFTICIPLQNLSFWNRFLLLLSRLVVSLEIPSQHWCSEQKSRNR